MKTKLMHAGVIIAKLLPKYFNGTIEKVEFDLNPQKLGIEDQRRIYLERFASAVRN